MFGKKDSVDKGLPFGLTRFLSWISLILILASSVMLAFFIGNSARNTLLLRQQQYAMLMASNLNQQIYRRFTLPTFLAFGRIALRQSMQYQQLDDVVQSTILGLHLESLRIYGADRVVNYSINQMELGRTDITPASMERVMSSGIPFFETLSSVNMLSAMFMLKIPDGSYSLRTMFPLTVDLGISESTGKPESLVTGVLEITQDITDDYDSVVRFQWLILATCLGSSTILFAILQFFIIKAERTLAERMSRNRKLEAELHRRYLSVRRLREWRDVRRQLVQLTDELGWRRNTSPATFEQVHRALLTGLLGNIGSKAVESDFRAPPYLGARGIKFWIWPGSARAKKAGRWILAAEIVETSRMFARCVADIEPEWIEAAAGDLLRRNWTEPHWEKSRGEVVAFERGTLYGLTIYQQRRVSFAPHDPKLARELFIRQALVEGDWDGRAEFYAHNARLVREIQDLEHKTRRPDVLVDDELMFAFYDERIPADVVSTSTLLKWLKATSRDDPKALFMSRDELMRHDASGVTNRYFPKTMEMAGISMALNYHFEPGSPRDGLTLAVPLYALNQLDAVRAEWLVPGMVKEKAQTLLKSLPQKIRRHCVPIADFAGGFFTRTKEGEPQAKGFLEALADDVRSQTGVPCTVGDFKLEQLPPHLIMNFKVLDEHGRQIGMGRNLAQLRAEFGEAAQETFRHVAQEDAAVAKDLEDGITDWTFGELPELMEIFRRGQTLIGHPALTDRGTDCAIEVYDDPLEARREHRKGLLRLFRLALREQVKFVERTLRDLGRVQMQAQTVPGLSRLFESADTLSTSVVDCALEATALAEPWPHDEASFRERREDVKGRLTLVAGEISRLLTEIVTEAAGIPLKLRRLSGEKALTDDIEAQLNDLFRKDFLTTVPLSQLAHYPRYLRAVHYRLDRYRDDPVRDESRRADIERLSVPLMRARVARRGQPDSRLDEFGWMLQELRVSLFAQQLRTPMPVSVKRLERVWMSITRL